MIQVLVVDDLRLVRAGLISLLSKEDDMTVIGQAGRGEEAVSLCRDNRPDVVLMDFTMPGIGGLEATRRIHRHDSNVKIIIICVDAAEILPSQMSQVGAVGYISKATEPGDLIHAIRAVHAGQCYIATEVAQLLALKQLSDSGKSPLDALTERELQIMLMITRGQKTSEISNRLCLSSKTVCSYRYRIFEKLDIDSDVSLTHFAIRHGMIDLTNN